MERLRELIREGKRRLVLVAPTGSGKTVIGSKMIHGATGRGLRCMFVVHRRELVNQSVDKLDRCGVPASVVMAGDHRFDESKAVQVCTIQTLARRLDRLPPANLVLIDEAHHSSSPSWKSVIDRYPEAVVIGLTATPYRMDKMGLADFFQGLVIAATTRELIETGDLVPYEAFAYDSPDLHSVRVVAGEYNQKDLEVACNTRVLVGSVVKEYLEHALGRRGLVFPVSIQHSRDLVAEFRQAGVNAVHLDCRTPDPERDQALADLEAGRVTLVSSVGILTEGFDCPAAEVCIIARPTKSLGLHIQMAGRVLRPAPGKLAALYHDHAGNFLRHGLPDDDRDLSLHTTPTRVRDMHTCPLCRALFGVLKEGKCPNCGELIAPPSEEGTRGARRGPEHVEGVRIDIQAIRERRAAGGIQRPLTDAELVKAARATRQEKIAEYLRLCDVRARNNFKKGFVDWQYRELFGVWPRFTDAELSGAQAAVRPFIPLARRAT